MPVEPQTTAFGEGDTAEYKGVQYTFLSVREVEGNALMKLAEGKVYVIAEFKIVNTSAEEVTISSIMMFTGFVDGYKDSGSMGAVMAADMSMLDGSLPAGKKLKGAFGFEVSPEWQEIEVSVSPDVLSESKIFFVYNK